MRERRPSAAIVNGARRSYASPAQPTTRRPMTRSPPELSSTSGSCTSTPRLERRAGLDRVPHEHRVEIAAQQRQAPHTLAVLPWMRTPPAPVTTMPRIGRPARSTSAAIPSRRRMSSAPGLSVSPHSLSRGKIARSSRRTRTPRAREQQRGDRAGRAGAGDQHVGVHVRPGPQGATRASSCASSRCPSTRALFFEPKPEAVAERHLGLCRRAPSSG